MPPEEQNPPAGDSLPSERESESEIIELDDAAIEMASDAGFALEEEDVEFEDDAPKPPRLLPPPIRRDAAAIESPALDGELLRFAFASPSALEAEIAQPVALAELAQRFERSLSEAESQGEQSRIALFAYELGELCESALKDEAKAVGAYGRALHADPSFRANLWAIRRIYYRRSLWGNLAKLVASEQRVSTNDDERVELLLEEGMLAEEHLQDDVAAEQAYRSALEIDAGAESAWLGLERIAERRGDALQREEAWDQLFQRTTNAPRKLAYALDLATSLRERGEWDRAKSVLQSAQQIAAGAPWAFECILDERERLALVADDPSAVLAVLDERLVVLQEGGLASAEVAHPESAPDFTLICRRAAWICADQLNDLERAWAYLQKAALGNPGDPLLVLDLSDVAERLGKFDDLADWIAAWQTTESDPDRGLALALRRVDALERSGKQDLASSLLDTASASSPTQLAVLARRERIAMRTGDRAAMANIYRDLAQGAREGKTLASTLSVVDLRFAAALEVCAGDLCEATGELEQAKTHYRRTLVDVPFHRPALEALVSLCERGGAYNEALAVLERASEGDASVATYSLERLADLNRRMSNPVGEASALRRLLAHEPTRRGLRFRFEQCLQAVGGHRERLELLLAIASELLHPDHRCAVLLQAARVADEDLGDLDQAIELYGNVVDSWPQDLFARSALQDALRRAGQWERLVKERVAQAALASDDAEASSALREAGDVLLHKLARPADAASTYRDLLDRISDDAAALMARVDALWAAGEKDAALEAMGAVVERQQEPAARLDALLRLAKRAESVEEFEVAQEAYERALAVNPGSHHAAYGLVECAIRKGDAEAEFASLARLSTLSESVPLKAALAESAAWLAALRLEDFERALPLFQSAASLGSPGARLGCALAEAKRGDSSALGDSLEALGKDAAGTYASSGIMVRAALLAQREGDEVTAADRFGRASALAPHDPAVLWIVSEHDRPLVLDGQRKFRDKDWQALAQRLESRAKITTDPALRRDLILDRAELLEVAGRLANAQSTALAILSEDPANLRALLLLRRIGHRIGDSLGAAKLSVALSEILVQPANRLALLREAAAGFATASHQVPALVAVYSRIVGLDPAADEFTPLAVLLEQHGDVAGLFALLGQRLASGHLTALDRAALLVKRAELRRASGDPSGCERDLAAALELYPGFSPALLLRALLASDLGDPARAGLLFQQYLDVEPDPEKRRIAEFQLAQLAEGMGDIEGAIEQLEHAIRAQPQDESLRERLCELLLRSGATARALEQYERLARARKLPRQRAYDEIRMGEIARDFLGDRQKARLAFERALNEDPVVLEGLQKLCELDSDQNVQRAAMERALRALQTRVAENPRDLESYRALGTVFQWMQDPLGLQSVVHALDYLGDSAASAHFQTETRSAPLLAISAPLTVGDWQLLAEAPSVAAQFWAIVATSAAKIFPHEPGQLGFGRHDRLRDRDFERTYPWLNYWARACQVEQAHFYVSAERPGFARVVSAEPPLVFLGHDVADARGPLEQFMASRVLAQAKLGTSLLHELTAGETMSLFSAAARDCDITPPGSWSDAATPVANIEKGLERALGRRERKAIGSLAPQLVAGCDPLQFRLESLRTTARFACLVTGDAGAALASLVKAQALEIEVADELVAWSVGPIRLDFVRRLRAA